MLWFWSNSTELRSLARPVSSAEIALAWFAIFVGASVLLALWESLREWSLSFQFENKHLLASRYFLTVWDTALVIISIAAMVLLNAPPPEIVYKRFETGSECYRAFITARCFCSRHPFRNLSKREKQAPELDGRFSIGYEVCWRCK